MAIRTPEEILNTVRERFGDDTSDDTLSFVEDISDTLNSLSSANANSTNWEQKYRENDEAWRKKYRDRFFSGGGGEDIDEPVEPPRKNYTYDSLFKEG